MKVFLKIVPNEFKNENRDMRELSVIESFNTDIIVMAKGEQNHTVTSNGYLIYKRTTRPLGSYNWLVKINRVLSVFTWACYAKKLRPHYISCHDLIALFIGWLSTWFIPKEKKPLLVYDSHEFEIGRNTNSKRNIFVKLIISKVERFLMKKCVFSIMVNDSIADEVQKIHKLIERPIVVRNISNYWNIDKSVCYQRKVEICEQLGVPVDTFIVMYHGRIMSGRGLEILLTSIQRNNSLVGVILGNGETAYMEHLKQMTIDLQITERVLYHKAVPINILWEYVGAADVGMSLTPNTCMNHFYMLPNKLFENIQSLTPIIGSNFPEISKIVSRYNIGLLVNPENVDEIVDAMDQLRTNKEMYRTLKNNLVKAKQELCWENESKILEKGYKKIIN